MALSFIATMFSSAARSAAKGSKQLLSRAGPAGARSLRAISKQVAPTLNKGFKFSRNIGKQSVNVLRKKERLSRSVSGMSKNFWRWGNNRIRQVNDRLQKLRQEPGGSKEAAFLKDEQARLLSEQSAFRHLQADEKSVLNLFKQERKHDLNPLLKKSNHAAKLAAYEDQAGAIDPRVLREYSAYELQLLRDIQAEEGWEHQVEVDEFKMMDILRLSLIREFRDLQLQMSQEVDPRIRARIKSRTRQILVEISMLQHAKHLAEKGDQQEKQLRKKSSGIYNLIAWLTGIEKKETAMIPSFVPAFAR